MRQVIFYKDSNIYIDLNSDMLTGDVLDIGFNNYGIIYNLYKQQNKDLSVEYLRGSEDKGCIEKQGYDNCVLLFSLSSIWLKINRKKLINDVYEFLKEDGIIHIWDTDKGYLKFFNRIIKLQTADSKLKDIRIADFNVFKDASQKSTIMLIEQFFEIIDLEAHDNVYYIKAKKRSMQHSVKAQDT